MKPVIRYRSGQWVCRGGGHSGSSRSPVAAYCAWRHAKALALPVNASAWMRSDYT